MDKENRQIGNNNYNEQTENHYYLHSKNEQIRFVGFPSLAVKVYGRNEEVNHLINFFLSHNRHCSIIAPSCFGKTFVIKKFLQNVNEQDEFFKDSFDKIIYFNCRETTDVISVCNNFATCLGIGELNPANLFAFIQNEKILCIFDNFESWNNNDNKEISDFLHRIFTTNNQLRTIFVSQFAINDRNIKDHVEDLTEIKAKLVKGLDKQSALEFIKAEANRKKVKLEKISDDELDKFFQKVYYIPQAIRSLIDYLNLKRRPFADFMKSYQAEFEAFEKSEKRFTKNYNDELRPTLYMIKLQIEAQDEKSKNLLSILSFFERNVPQVLIEAFREEVDVAEIETIHLLTDNRLVEETKVFRGKDFYYYSPHLVIKDVAREVLPKFEDKYSKVLEPLANDLFILAHSNHNRQHNYEEAISLYECQEKLLDYLISQNGRTELANDLAAAYLNKGNSLKNLGRLNEAIIEQDKAIGMLRSLVDGGRTELVNDLASVYVNKGNSLNSLGRLDEAIKEFEKAIEIRKPLVDEGRTELINDLAGTYINKGISLAISGRLNESIVEHDKAIGMLKPLVDGGRTELVNDLASVYVNKGVSLYSLGRLNESIKEFEKAIEIRKPLVDEGRTELVNDLASVYVNKGVSLYNLGKLNESIEELEKVIGMLKPLVDEGRAELANNLATAYINKGMALEQNRDSAKSVKMFNDAINLWEGELSQGFVHNLPNLVKAFPIRVDSLIKLEDWAEIATDAVKSLMLTSFYTQIENISEHHKQQIRIEFSRLLYLIKQLPSENQEKIFTEANKFGQEEGNEELLGDTLRQYVQQFED